jgi:hypothetical protein
MNLTGRNGFSPCVPQQDSYLETNCATPTACHHPGGSFSTRLLLESVT